jgi:hypothetical protein
VPSHPALIADHRIRIKADSHPLLVCLVHLVYLVILLSGSTKQPK